MKIIIVIMLVAVVSALGLAGAFMLKKRDAQGGRGKHMARALALRVGLSVALFLFVLLSYQMGWIQPRGIPL